MMRDKKSCLSQKHILSKCYSHTFKHIVCKSSLIWLILGLITSNAFLFLHHIVYFPHDNNKWFFWPIFLIVQFVMYFKIGQQAIKLIEHSAKDPLTELYNRRFMCDILSGQIDRIKRTSSNLSIAIIDLDKFKQINDLYGHLEGDKVLKTISSLLIRNKRSGDILIRWGGEEFALIMPDTDCVGAKVVAERIRSTIEMCDFGYRVTICAGIATISAPIAVNELISMADKALYEAKKERNMVVNYCAS